ncbi:MAG: hypothetical protein AB7O88_23930 [Reyranellaceae bacterium]
MLGVPIWRDAPVSLGQVINHRVVWAALAMIIGIDSISMADSYERYLGIFHVVLPGVLCAAGAAFALWQLWLVAVAARRTLRDGSNPRLATLALAGTALAAAAVIGILHEKAVPQLMEMWDIQNGDKKSELHIIVSSNGHTLVVDGRLGIGAAQRVKDALDANPTIRTVITAGPGGRLGAAYEIYALIRARRLDTRAIRTCYSACTMMFLGGVHRSVGSAGRLGFHRTSFPGMDEAELAEGNRYLRDFMIFAGVDAAFVRKVMNTPPDSMWVPTHEELLDAGVIHRSDARRN